PQMRNVFHKLRMDYDTYSAVATPLRLVYIVSLETPDVEDIPQAENGLRHLFCSSCSFEINLSLLQQSTVGEELGPPAIPLCSWCPSLASHDPNTLGDCRNVVPIASMFGSAWDCNRGVCRLLEDDIPTVTFWFDGWRHGVCRLLEGDMAYVAFPSRRPRRMGCDRGYVAFLKTTYSLSPSGLMDGDMGVCRILNSVGLKPGRPSPSPSLVPLLSPSLSLALSKFPAVLGFLPRVEVAVLRTVSLRSCRGSVHVVRCEEETFLPTRRPQQVRSSSGGGYVAFLKTTYPLSPSGLMDGAMGYVGRLLEGDMAYVAFPSRRPRRMGCDRGYVAFLKTTYPLSPSGLMDAEMGAYSGAEGKTVVRTVACESLEELSWLVWDAEDSLEFYPAQASQSFFSLPRSLRPRNRESSQQRQGARRAEETGR
ncbi:hypothetical protein Taro_013387, partial [Colocasia esculenta]|nr:hypothetical protein [Colocasia esculenta]